jgi:fatty acid-binding protein DegV
VLDGLDYMKKGGRCSAVSALGANLLKLHPCIEVQDGKMGVTRKYRGSMEKAVADYLHERLDGRDDLDTHRVILVDTCQDDTLTSIARSCLEADGRFGEILEAKAGCTIFSHCGPNVLGLLLLRK